MDLVAALVIGAALARPAHGFQGATDDDRPSPPVLDPMPAADGGASIFDGSLRREGSFIVAVPGTIGRARDPDGWWQFTPLDAGSTPMTLLPCSLLASLTQIADRTGSETVVELTGEVLNYRGANYLLPTYSPRVARYTPPEDVAAPERDESRNTDDPREIIDRLEREVGPVPRLPAGASTLDTGSPQLREGSLITWRRGWMSREADGAWVFTLAADAGGGEEPELVILPCLLLERLERLIERRGPRQPLLVSGRVYRYDRRAYLLPTAFQVPRERTPIRE